jgi:hypothetical protein
MPVELIEKRSLVSSSKGKTAKTRETKDSSRGRVFIIGAGVSASCGIAVANQILREAVMRMESSDSVKTDRIHKLLQYLYPNFDKRIRNYPNIEDFLNLLEMARKFNSEEFIASSAWSRPKLEEVKRFTLRAVTDYIWDRMADAGKQRVVHEFVRQNLREGDTIITFNWDLTFERALENYPGHDYLLDKSYGPCHNTLMMKLTACFSWVSETWKHEASVEYPALLKQVACESEPASIVPSAPSHRGFSL